MSVTFAVGMLAFIVTPGGHMQPVYLYGRAIPAIYIAAVAMGVTLGCTLAVCTLAFVTVPPPPPVARAAMPSTATPEPIATLAPTEPPAPTAVPIPSITAVPTAVPYRTAASLALADYAKTSDTIGKLILQMADEPSLLYDGEWRLSIAVQMNLLKLQGADFRQMTPPPELSAAHSRAVQAMRHYDTAMDLASKSFDGMDANLMDKAMTELRAGTADIKAAKDLIR